MDRISQAQDARSVYQGTLQTMLERLACERALIFYGYDADGVLIPRAGHGLDHETVYTTGEVSLEVMREPLESGEPANVIDALEHPRFGDRTSTIISGVRSVLCVPLKDSDGTTVGLVYADNRIQSGAFEDVHMEALVQIGKALSGKLTRLGG